jgi:hypothetical protein
MCRNIKPLYHFDPPVTDEEIRAAALQFVRKISGFNKPSQANEAAFLAAVETIAAASANLLDSLETNAPVRIRTAAPHSRTLLPAVSADVPGSDQTWQKMITYIKKQFA